MVRGNITATSLKMLWKNLHSVKCYDKLNMNVFTLSLWKNFWWGLIYFDQFIFKTWASTRETLSSEFENNKGPDQPVHPCRLVSAFVIISSVAFLRHFIEYALWGGGCQGGSPLYGSMCEAMWQKMFFCAIQRAKRSP